MESFSEEWSRQWDSQQKMMLRIFLILMIFGGLICFMAFNGSFLFTYYYPYNYAPYYLLVATMILQTGICEGMIIRFMMKKAAGAYGGHSKDPPGEDGCRSGGGAGD